MLITKSLFVDYMDFPKLARWKVHDRQKYNKICKIETDEEKQHIIQLGQQVEDAVLEYLRVTDGREMVNLIPDFHEDAVITDPGDDDDERVDDFVEKYASRQTLCANTLAAIRDQKPILYQPSFQRGDCFVRADVMILQPNGQYKLIEIKAKSGVRKTVTDDGEKKKIGQLEEKFIHDLSFQKYVINHVLQDAWVPVLDSIWMAHLNKEYVKQWTLDYTQLIILDQMDRLSEVIVLQGKNSTEKTIERDDTLSASSEIQDYVRRIQAELVLAEDEFNKVHPFAGNKYLEYFAPVDADRNLKKPFGTIYAIPKLHFSKASVVQALHEQGVRDLASLTYEQRELFYGKNGMWSAGEFIELYCACVGDGKPHITPANIQEKFSSLSYPICFYDYESVSTPIPFMDNTYPYQQVVVQYSLHKLYADGTMKHYGGVLGWLDWQGREQLTVEHQYMAAVESDVVVHWTYKDLLQSMLTDIGEDINRSSFVVWYKGFENSRNKEIAELFPDVADDFLAINDKTFDLMDVFAHKDYFDIAFEGSSSIKKVLPVLVPDMDYSGLTIGNGGMAMKKLHEVLAGMIHDKAKKEELLQDLLIYCGQDSLAMVKIFQTLAALL